jgi:hypothetical protein
MVAAYVRGFPQDGASLGSTKAQIRDNLDGTFDTLSIDHKNQNETNTGYHKVIHIVSNAGDPPQVSGIGQLYTKSISSAGNTDTSLFFETGGGGGRKLQLTSNFIPVMAANGVTFLPGSAASPMPLIQWGTQAIASGSSDSGTITFPRPFQTAVFSIQLQLVSKNASTSSSNNSLFVNGIANVTNSQFDWRYNGGSGDFPSFYWVAIGN